MTLEEAQRDPQAFLAGFVDTERSVHFDPELARRQRELLEGSMPEQTRVVNVKAGAPYTIYIGRANGRYHLRQSTWHNPFKIGPHGTREEVLAQYGAYVLGRPELLARIGELHGQTLGCWCAPVGGFQSQLLCHGQILAALADGLPLERAGEAG